MSEENRRPRPDLSVLRMDPEELGGRRGAGWLVWLVVIAVLVAGAYFTVVRWKPPFLQPQVETATVRLETPQQKSTVLTATGYTYARQRAAVGAKIIGRILQIAVDEGDVMKAGDLIAVLDSQDLQAAVDQARSALAEARTRVADAERTLGRQQRLVAAEIVPQAALDDAETAHAVAGTQVDAALARLASAEAQLAYTRIYAPIDGVVIEKNVEVGEMVAPGGFTSQQSTGAILRLADPASLEVEADVNESYIARLRLGMPASIAVDAVPGRAYRGRLRQIVPTADRQRAVVQVKVTIEDRDENLVPDMSSSVTFLEEETTPESLAAAPILYVAQRAVVGELGEAGGQAQVFVLEDGRVQRRAVELGAKEGEERIVVDGLRGGEVVVISDQAELEDGQKVRVRR